MTKLRVHWDQVVEKSTVWKSQIDFLIEEWKRFLELRDELTQWMKKADAYFEREENVYVYTVSELEEQIDQHKVSIPGRNSEKYEDNGAWSES